MDEADDQGNDGTGHVQEVAAMETMESAAGESTPLELPAEMDSNDSSIGRQGFLAEIWLYSQWQITSFFPISAQNFPIFKILKQSCQTNIFGRVKGR